MTQLEKCTPYHSKVYIFGKLFLQGIQKWLYFCGRGKSKNIMADQLLVLFMLSLFRVAPFSENTAFQGGPDIHNATT